LQPFAKCLAPCPPPDARRGPDGRWTWPWINATVGDVLFDVAHHQSASIRNRTTSLSNEVGFFFERKAREREQVPERVALVRAHVHGYRMLEDDGVIAISLPAWKLQDEFAKMLKYPKRNRGRSPPCISPVSGFRLQVSRSTLNLEPGT